MKRKTNHRSLGKTCLDCGKEIVNSSTYCRKHFHAHRSVDADKKAHTTKIRTQRYKPLGHKFIDSDGYVKVKISDGDGNGNHRQYKTEHRLIVEANIGRKLEKNEQVHHIDGNRINNSLENLYVMRAGRHYALNGFLGLFNASDVDDRRMILRTLRSRYPGWF